MVTVSGIRRSMQTKALNQAKRYSDQEATMLALIEKAARSGLACPSNDRMARALGFASSGAPQAVLKRLEQKGIVEIGRDGRDRVIRVISSGLQTAGIWKPLPASATGTARKRMTRKDRFAEALAECGDVNFAGYMIGVAHDTARRLFAEICADLGSQAQ